jgi:hypothetical protein
MNEWSSPSTHFTETEDSLPSSHDPATCPYLEPEESSTHLPFLLSKMYLNILPLTPGPSKWYPSLGLKNAVCIFVSDACHMLHPSRSP